MKLKLLAFLICLSCLYKANATVHIITAEGLTIPTDIFLPGITYAVVGDTIQWVWISGYHTTESISIPTGAASWSALLDANNTSFSYVVTVVGNYNFDCHASTPHGMDGSFVVTLVAGVSHPANIDFSLAYPNPFADRITIEFAQADKICVYNLMGQRLKTIAINNGETQVGINLSNYPKGIYFYSIESEGNIIETSKIVRN